MPQLNPSPWLYTFICSWIVLLLVIPSKTLKHCPLNDPTTQPTKISNKTWHWPWP